MVGRDIYHNHIVVQEYLLLGSWFNVKLTKSKTSYFIVENIQKKEAGNQIYPANNVTLSLELSCINPFLGNKCPEITCSTPQYIIVGQPTITFIAPTCSPGVPD